MNIKNYGFLAVVFVASLHAAKQDVVQFCSDKKAIETVFETAKKDNKLVVIDFFAEWCGPCKMMAPTFERLAGEMKDTCIFVKVDVDQCKQCALEYGVQAMPTIIIMRDDKEVARMVGSKTYTVLKEQVEACVKGGKRSPAVLREQLQTALQTSDVEAVKELIKEGVDVKTPFENQITPLLMPVMFGAQQDGDKAAQVINALLDAGAEWEGKDIVQGQEVTVSLIDCLQMSKKNCEKIISNYDIMIASLEKRDQKKK